MEDEDKERFWSGSGLRQFQIVRCLTTAHRERFGVDVEVVEPNAGYPAFIDFVVLAEVGRHLTPDEFPPVGSTIEAVVLDFAPRGELRLSARQSDLEIQRSRDQSES